MKIALDIDDVLAGFSKRVHELLGEKDTELIPHDHWSPTSYTGKLICEADDKGNFLKFRDEYLEKCEENPHFWLSLESISKPEDIDFKIDYYITSSPKEMVKVRKAWLKYHGFPDAPVIHSNHKEVTMKELGVDVLVDDKLSTVKKVNATEGLRAIHFRAWYCSVRTRFSISNLNQLSKYI